MDLGLDASFVQPVEQRGASGHLNYIEMVRREIVGRLSRPFDFAQVSQFAIVASRQRTSSLYPTLQLSQLAEAQGALDVAQPIVVSQFRYFVPPRFLSAQLHERAADSVMAQAAQPLIDLLVIGGNRAALAARNVFYRVKAEDRHVGMRTIAHALPAARAIAPACAQGVAGILDDSQAGGPRQA